MIVTANLNQKRPYNSACPNIIQCPNIITQKFIKNFSSSLDTVEWALFHPKNSPPSIGQMYLQYTVHS